MIYLLYLVLLLIIELAYFKIADRYNIIDKPNHRSSHTEITIRGGGVIFPFSVFLWFVFSGLQYPWFVAGLLLISAISFLDDIKDFSRRLRLLAHLLAMLMVFWQLGLFSVNWIYIPVAFVLLIGVINAYNFMDGINGITGLYSAVALLTLLWINTYKTYFIDSSLLLSVIIGVLIFNFFNFRKKAACFAGDVGSISIAFIICFLLIKLIFQTSDIRYVLLLAVYGVDAVFTIILRLLKGENIFLAHRSHLYQLMVSERKFKHLTVATLYAFMQLIINWIIVVTTDINKYQLICIILIILSVFYIIFRNIVASRRFTKRVRCN
ncbi:glycosyltransferase family 4 protein [Mucilaginibacter mali]|uniref:Glycosyltransferase family 4 protein n=1 Tax=Mucilaginibacter mali TaxID=2740462 RepID=A0A7D4TLN8_9SPHI|nr:glycosyltransferase family 4 protein [Mucilaginibacter mali]QKJ29413.1 glycosyltransferase family 4 protein [Mucilaginibacter mali]